MRFLPVVERELRTAARRRSTYALRLLAALAAFGVVLWTSLQPAPGQTPSQMGQSLFLAMSAMATYYGLLIGPFITADCLSSEKRDGTLGLLFLTDLTSLDVVLGKWAAASLAAFYGLLAVVPALGIPLLLGGVTAGEYGRTTLVVVNAILFSLTAGMFVSSVSRDQTKATLGSFILVLALSGLLPGLLALVIKGFLGASLGNFPRLVPSPIYASRFVADAAYNMNPARFWASLGTVHAFCWAFMIAATVIVGRVWRRQTVDREPARRWWWRLGRTPRWQRRLQQRQEANPVYALASRHRWPHWVFWALVGVVAVNVYWIAVGYRRQPAATPLHLDFNRAMVFINRVWIAAMACYFFVEARQRGALELLLTTPIEPATIRGGRRRALFRLFFWPVLAIAMLHAAYVWAAWRPYASQPNSEAVFGNLATTAMIRFVDFLTDIFALTAVGGWLSLSAKRLPFVVLATFALVTLAPWAALHLLGGAQLLQKTFGPFQALALQLVLPAKNLLFLIWACYNLRRHFRSAAAGTHREKTGARPVLQPT